MLIRICRKLKSTSTGRFAGLPACIKRCIISNAMRWLTEKKLIMIDNVLDPFCEMRVAFCASLFECCVHVCGVYRLGFFFCIDHWPVRWNDNFLEFSITCLLIWGVKCRLLMSLQFNTFFFLCCVCVYAYTCPWS